MQLFFADDFLRSTQMLFQLFVQGPGQVAARLLVMGATSSISFFQPSLSIEVGAW
jgi:hypothetical protein